MGAVEKHDCGRVQIHDGPYNAIMNWDYEGMVKCLNNGQGRLWTAKVQTEEQLEDAIAKATNEHKNHLCFIEYRQGTARASWPLRPFIYDAANLPDMHIKYSADKRYAESLRREVWPPCCMSSNKDMSRFSLGYRTPVLQEVDNSPILLDYSFPGFSSNLNMPTTMIPYSHQKMIEI
eukprot:1072523-Pelagomonas_calceolata.AAC.2